MNMKLNSYDYDLFVIGAGSGGVRASRTAANLGARVAVAEERYFGGTCVNVGCIPKKLYSYAAHYKDDFEDSRGFGWESSDTRFDWRFLNRTAHVIGVTGISQPRTQFGPHLRTSGTRELKVSLRA